MTEDTKTIKYLNAIDSPEDLKSIPVDEMPQLAQEIRHELVRIVNKNGGHLASNLGGVELTMAIHRVFDSPKDHIIFDVGHQSYVHKMLTGRYAQMDTLRQSGGLCGFTNREESVHDCFGAGHSSTSLSAGLGFAISDKLNGASAYTVVVVGDGAYTGGMIHEALNNCRKDLNLIIILNENEMSISKNIGRFATNLAKLRTSPGYFKTKKATGVFLKKIPFVGKYLFKFVLGIKKLFKNTLYSSNYFESMGLTYLGPIDGNDYSAVESLLKQAKTLGESVVVHLKTVKGKGFSPAEQAPDLYHGMSPSTAHSKDKKTFSTQMGHIISELAENDNRICAITAAMCDGTGLNEFKDRHADRFFDVGIAEEHALTFAAGLAANGMRPFCAIYSTFLQRGFDNIIHDIALQKLPVIICVDRAGLNAGDGSTHHGLFDVAFLSQIPNLKIYTPITDNMLKICILDAMSSNMPCVIRYPNGTEDGKVVSRFYSDIIPLSPSARCDYSCDDDIQMVIVTHGRMVNNVIVASDILREQGIKVGIILLEALKPYDTTVDHIYKLLPPTAKGILFVEEEIRNGGMGMILCDMIHHDRRFSNVGTDIIAVEDNFVTDRKEGESIYTSANIDITDICHAVELFLM